MKRNSSASCSYQSKRPQISRSLSVEFGLSSSDFLCNLEHATKYEPDFYFLKINNLPSIVKAFELISQESFKKRICSFKNLLGISLKVNEEIEANLNEKPHFYVPNFKEKFFIAFQSTFGEHESKTFWKIHNCEKFFSLFIDDDETEDVSSFFHEFLIDEIKNGSTGIMIGNPNKSKIHLHEIGDSNGRSLLGLAIFHVRANVVKNLLKHEFDPDDVIDLAWKIFEETKNDKNHSAESANIVLYLLNANSKFPINFDYSKASKEIQDFVDLCENFHNDVDENNFDELKRKLGSESNLIYFYDRKNQSLLAHAIIAGRFELLQYIDKGLNTGSHENLADIYEKLEEIEKCDLGRQRQGLAVDFPESHLYVLKSKTKIGNIDSFSHKHWKYVDEAYKTVNSNSYCSKILKLAAKWKNLKIFFDFKHDSVFYMDPPNFVTSGNVGGTFNYNENRKCTIIIGAKYLTDEERKFEVFKVLAHEFCHLAVHMTFFQDGSEPYPLGESQIKEQYRRVMEQCKINKKSEKIIKNVFRSYEEDDLESEMIVTVPEMLIKYLNDPERIEDLKFVYKLLFDYSTNVVEPEIDRTLSVLKWLEDEEKTFNFSDLTESMKAKILNTKINFQGEETSLDDLIRDDRDIGRDLTPHDIRKILLRDKILLFGDTCEICLKYKIIERKFVDRYPDDEHRSTLYRMGYEGEILNKPGKTLDQVRNEMNNSKVILLADHAGTGKTTTLIYLTLELKQDMKDYWISYINLRECIKFFELFKKNDKKISAKNIQKVLLQMINIDSKIEAKIFSKLFSHSKVILLFDGLDEICPQHTQLMFEIFNVLRESEAKIELWISTRPHYAKKVEEFFNISGHKFDSLSTTEMENLIKEVLDTTKFDDERKEKLLDDIKIYILLYDINNHTNMDNLLMIEIIAEVRIFEGIQLHSNSWYGLYTAMVEKQKKKVGEKIPLEDHDKDSKINVWDVHRVLALIYIIGYDNENLIGFNIRELPIMKRWRKEKRNWTSDMIQRYGFVVVDLDDEEIEKTSISFMHRSYAEFFVAQFITNFIMDDDDTIGDKELRWMLQLFHAALGQYFVFEEVRKFIRSYFKNEAIREKVVFCDKIKGLIAKGISRMHNRIKEPKWAEKVKSLVEKYSVVARIHPEISIKLWKLDANLNLLEEFVSMENKYDHYFIKSAEKCFGSNWHENFNKSEQKLITETEIIELIEIKPSDLSEHFDWKEDVNFLKCCDIVDKNFEISNRMKFYETLATTRVGYTYQARAEKILRTRKVFGREKFAIKFIVNTNYFPLHHCYATLKFIHEIFEKDYNNDREAIKRILLTSPEFNKTLSLILSAQLPKIFDIVQKFYEKYLNSWEELRDGIIASRAYDVIIPAQESTYDEYKNLIQKVFGNDTLKFAEQIDKFFNYFEKLSFDLRKIENLRDFLLYIFKNDDTKVSEMLKKVERCSTFYEDFKYDDLSPILDYRDVLDPSKIPDGKTVWKSCNLIDLCPSEKMKIQFTQ